MSRNGYMKKTTQQKKEEAIKALGEAIRQGRFGKVEFVRFAMWILQLADQDFLRTCNDDSLHKLTNVRRWRDGEQMPISGSQISDAIRNCAKPGLSYFCLEIWRQVTETLNTDGEAIQLGLSEYECPKDELAMLKERVGNLEIAKDAAHDWIETQASIRGIMQRDIKKTMQSLNDVVEALNTAFPMLNLKVPDDPC